jgi:hypothetical protein
MWTFIGAVLASSVVGTFVGHVLTARRDELGFRRQKLEALHLHVTAFNDSVVQIYVPYLLAMKGEHPLTKAQEMVTRQVTKQADERHLEQARMLTSLYFPRVQPALDTLLKWRDQLMSPLTKFQRGDFRPNPEAAAQLDAALNNLKPIEEELRVAMIREARALDRSWWYQLPRLRGRS